MRSGFCQQTDTHYPRQTVREALVFSANLRQPNGIPRNEMEAQWVLIFRSW